MSKPEICGGELQFMQDNHTEATNGLGEYLTVKMHGVAPDYYYTLHTEEWSVDSPAELLELLERAVNALEGKQC